jgi:hypothetical protein
VHAIHSWFTPFGAPHVYANNSVRSWFASHKVQAGQRRISGIKHGFKKIEIARGQLDWVINLAGLVR